MRIFLKILVTLGAVLITVGKAQAQLDNRAFTSPQPGLEKYIYREGILNPDGINNALVDSVSRENAKLRAQKQLEESIHADDLRLSLYSFTFFKDNEYFNKIVDGYTLFGTQLNPQLVYYPTKDLRLEAGVFLWKDFGNPELKQVRPTYRATWTVNKHQFILGNIRANLNHNYIEPLFNFERVMLNPLEEGLQYRYSTLR